MEDYVTSDGECYYEDDDEEHFEEEFSQDADDFSLSSESKGPLAKVITKESLLAAQREVLHKIMDMLSVRQHHARILLIHFRWNVEKIFELYVEIGIDKLFAAAGVKVVEHHDPCATASSLTCDICIDDKPANQFTAMDCGHYFCNECWTNYFIVKINDGQSRRIRCMAHKCNSICDDAKVKTLVNAKDSQLAEKFHRVLLESYVEDNNRVKWCPSVPHCGNAIRVENDELCEVECPCGLQYCFSCSNEAHSPCLCIMWDLWMKKCQDESETVNWITVNTKLCPKCHKLVEKNGGCNLVVCVCGQAFCWLCGGATGREHTWTSISNHSCGRYKDLEKKTDRARELLHRYLHYYNRYKAHKDSCKLEAKLKEDIHQKLKALEEKASIFYNKGVTNALTTLFRSRRMLSNSYAFAFYMFGDDLFRNEMTNEAREIKQNLFEDQQQQLEANIEKLSMCLEEPFGGYDDDKVTEIKIQILNMSIIVGNLCKKLHECIENDLLGSLEHTIHVIAPYYSKGAEKAMALCSAESLKKEQQ